MIDVDVDADRLHIHFTSAEALVGLVHDLDLPLAEVQSVQHLRDPWQAPRGRRIGLGLRGVWLLGTWWRGGHRQLVALRRDQQALRIRMRTGFYEELLVSTPHPDLVADMLGRRGVKTGRLVAV
jgi:hypothetical protein